MVKLSMITVGIPKSSAKEASSAMEHQIKKEKWHNSVLWVVREEMLDITDFSKLRIFQSNLNSTRSLTFL